MCCWLPLQPYSFSAKLFVKGLLQRSKRERLGGNLDYHEIMQHPWLTQVKPSLALPSLLPLMPWPTPHSSSFHCGVTLACGKQMDWEALEARRLTPPTIF